MSRTAIWVIGDWREPVFEDAVAWLRSRAECEFFDSPVEACANPTSGYFPRVIVFVHSRPGRFSVEQIEKVHAREPLAQLVALTGPWCEGEQRSGRPVAGVVRIPWRNWLERLPVELALGDRRPVLPRTASDTERFERAWSIGHSLPAVGGRALILSACKDVYSQIADAIQKLRFVVVPVEDCAAPPDVIVFDGWEQASTFGEPSLIQNRAAHTRKILLLHFPRPEDHILARQAGIDAVVGQPLVLADMMAACIQAMIAAA